MHTTCSSYWEKRAPNITLCNLLAALLWQKNSMNVRKNSSGGDSYSTKKLVQFFIILYCKSDVPRNNTALFVITSSISCKLKNLSTEIFEDSSEVYWCSSSNTGSVLSLTKVTPDTSNRELKSCLC